MRKLMGQALAALLTVTLCATGAARGDEDSKGSVVALDDLKSTSPADWVKQSPTSSLRHAQFKLPAGQGGKGDGLLIVYKGIGGSPEANVARWKGQFTPPEGKAIDDVANVTAIKIGGRKGTRLDVHGTYKGSFGIKGGPNHQMVAIYWVGPKTTYQFYLTGPKKTVEKHLDGFNKWIKNFK